MVVGLRIVRAGIKFGLVLGMMIPTQMSGTTAGFRAVSHQRQAIIYYYRFLIFQYLWLEDMKKMRMAVRITLEMRINRVYRRTFL